MYVIQENDQLLYIRVFGHIAIYMSQYSSYAYSDVHCCFSADWPDSARVGLISFLQPGCFCLVSYRYIAVYLTHTLNLLE